MRVVDVYGPSWDEEFPTDCKSCGGKVHPGQGYDSDGHTDAQDCMKHLRREDERLAVTVRQLERALIKHGALPKQARVATKRATGAEKE